jgi:hypothetical protein
VGFVVDKVALEQVFSEYFSLPCQFSFHRLLHTHHLLSGAGTVSPHLKKLKTKKKKLTSTSEIMLMIPNDFVCVNVERRGILDNVFVVCRM